MTVKVEEKNINTIENMLPLGEVNKDLKEENTEEYKNLPKELLEQNWILNQNELLIPYPYHENPPKNIGEKFFFSIVKEKDYYYITWKQLLVGEDIYAMNGAFKTKNFITIDDPKRNKKLGQDAVKCNLPRDEGKIKEYWERLILPLNKHKVKELLDYNTEKLENEKENQESEDDTKTKYETFEDYPDYIKKMAKKEIENDNVIKNIEYNVSVDHSGNYQAIKTDIYANGTYMLKENQLT